MKDCIFCKIALGEVSSRKVFEDENYFAFLDAFPTMKGQVLVIPKKHLGGYFFDLGQKEMNELMNVSKKVAKSMDKNLKSLRVGVVIEGLEVDHVHIKLFPLFGSGIDFKDKINLSGEELENLANKIKRDLER